MQVRDGGVWKNASPHVKDGGVWKPVQEVWVKDAGVWKQEWANGIYSAQILVGSSASSTHNTRGFSGAYSIGSVVSSNFAGGSLYSLYVTLSNDGDLAKAAASISIGPVASIPRWKEIRSVQIGGVTVTGLFSQTTDFKTGEVLPNAQFIPGGTSHLNDEKDLVAWALEPGVSALVPIYNNLTPGAVQTITFR